MERLGPHGGGAQPLRHVWGVRRRAGRPARETARADSVGPTADHLLPDTTGASCPQRQALGVSVQPDAVRQRLVDARSRAGGRTLDDAGVVAGSPLEWAAHGPGETASGRGS
ncbi:hypothetical protein ABN028_14280 [Actinopolymorpha sp. B17G11]|uniref:hypothetical protein n=1 Tax=Actinopolymorpha sp. B17G11 TaxID=3160861 RepID=UPI0032E3C2A3